MATPASNVIPLTSDPRIDGLVQGSAWQFGANPRVITYQLTTNDTGIGGTWASEPAIANAVAQAFSEWAKVANITFSSLGLGGTFPNSNAHIPVTLTGFELQENLGPAGLGKSRLVQGFVVRHRAGDSLLPRVYRGSARENDGAFDLTV